MDSSSATARICLGQAYTLARMCTAAIGEFEKSLEAGSADVKGCLGRALALAGSREEAERLLASFLSEAPQRMSPTTVRRRSRVLWAIGLRPWHGWRERSTRGAGTSPI